MSMDKIADVKRFAEYEKNDFVIGKTQFHIEKLLPMDGFRVLEKLRSAAGDKLSTIENSDNAAVIIAQVFLAIPPHAVEEILHDLVSEATFTNDNSKTPTSIGDLTGLANALQGLDAFAVYELLIRGLVINFFSSFTDLISKLEKAAGKKA